MFLSTSPYKVQTQPMVGLIRDVDKAHLTNNVFGYSDVIFLHNNNFSCIQICIFEKTMNLSHNKSTKCLYNLSQKCNKQMKI